MGGLLGMAIFLAIAIAVAIDMIDQRIMSPAEVKRAIGFPPVGIVLEQAPGALAFADEHFRRLVNGIQRGIAAQEAKCVVLTPLSDARNSGSLAIDIGRALLARGLKTVIVDANPRKGHLPASAIAEDIRYTDGLPSDSGARVRLDVGSPQEISRIPLVAHVNGLLNELRREYDVVLIDTPPLRLSADTELLASISDITLVVVEAGKATRRELIQGTTLLGRVGTPSIGVILNRVRVHRAGGALKREFKHFSSLSLSALTNQA